MAKTDVGKMVTVTYAIFTIPLMMAVLSLCANAIKYSLQLLIVAVEKRILRRNQQKILHFHPKCLILESVTLIICILLHASIYTNMKILTDSRYIETVYSVFIMTSTIGFGDFEYDTKKLQHDSDLEKLVFALSDLLFKFINLALLGSFFSTFSEFQLKLGSRKRCKNKKKYEKGACKGDREVTEEIEINKENKQSKP